jgi:uncharacterized protein (DUF2141 family)
MGTMRQLTIPVFLQFASMLAVMPVPARATETCTLTVRVENVSAKGGIVRLGLYDAAGYPDNDSTPVAATDVPAQPGETVVVLHGIRPGTYAIETFQDINANGKMDTSWFGFPEEPYGFSRDASPFLSKPRFASVAFPIAVGGNEQMVRLQNSRSQIESTNEPANGF